MSVVTSRRYLAKQRLSRSPSLVVSKTSSEAPGERSGTAAGDSGGLAAPGESAPGKLDVNPPELSLGVASCTALVRGGAADWRKCALKSIGGKGR